MKRKKGSIIITGAMGQDGRILSKILIEQNYYIYGWIKKNNYENKLKNVNYSEINLLDKKNILRKIKKIKPLAVVHFGSSNPSFSEKKNSKKLYLLNIKPTINLIDSIVESNTKCTFLFSNSSQIFLNKILKKNKVNENDRISFNDPYTKFRVQVFKYLEYLKKTKDFKFVNLILFNHDSILRNKKFLIPKLINAFKKKNLEYIKNIFTENIKGDFSHADDICEAIALLIDKKIQTSNLILSSGKITKINEIIKYLCKVTNLKIIFKNKIKNNNKYVIGSNFKAKKLLNWSPKKNIYDVVNEYFK